LGPSNITPGHHRTTSDPTADSTSDAAHPQSSRLPSRHLVPPTGTPDHHHCWRRQSTTTAAAHRRSSTPSGRSTNASSMLTESLTAHVPPSTPRVVVASRRHQGPIHAAVVPSYLCFPNSNRSQALPRSERCLLRCPSSLASLWAWFFLFPTQLCPLRRVLPSGRLTPVASGIAALN
jgi:hypothetical protein